jgi:hypothetical protein
MPTNFAKTAEKKEKKTFNAYQAWLGLGYKGGGTLFIPGIETIGGTLRNFGMMEEHHDFSILNVRIGIGLGASVGVCACLVFDCLNLHSLHNTQVNDWSINASLGAKWDSIVKGLKNYKFFETLQKIAKNSDTLKNATPKDIENIKTGMSFIYSSAEIVNNNKSPKLIIVDIPAAGVGLELSGYWTQGKIEMES